MEFLKTGSRRGNGGVRLPLARSLALLAGLGLAVSVSHAQQPAQQQAPAAGQQAAKTKPAAKAENSWVKLCEEKPIIQAGGVPSKRKVCLTHHERLSAVNGQVLVSAAVRSISEQNEEYLMVLVPLGVALPPGLQVRVDDEKPIPLKFTFCHVGGCTAEAVATKEIVEKFKKGAKIDVLAINNVGKTVGFPIPLNGFTKAYEGEPVDTKKYQEARRKLMKLIQSRRAELAKKAAAAQKKKQQEGGGQAQQQQQQKKAQ